MLIGAKSNLFALITPIKIHLLFKVVQKDLKIIPTHIGLVPATSDYQAQEENYPNTYRAST